MLKLRIISFLLIVFILPSSIVFGQASSNIDLSQIKNGLVNVAVASQKEAVSKVMISKGNEKYTYSIKSNNAFPLQLGDGEYTVAVLENVQGNKYKVIESQKVTYKAEKANDVFLQSIQLINWSENSDVAKKAFELTKNAANDNEKIQAIYNYIVKNINYDYAKASSVKAEYIPDLNSFLKDSKGICYDYASLFAAMLRSVGVPAKLIMGNKDDINGYHAWNQVFLKDSNKWVSIDTTYDSIMLQNKRAASMIKNDKSYSIDKQY